MPELPEVETIRRALEPLLVGRRIRQATLFRRDVLVMPSDPPGGFSRQRGVNPASPASFTPGDLLEGSVVRALRRRGKQLAIVSEPRVVIVQLGMSGQLLAHADVEQPTALPTHVHARWITQNGATVLFRDPRRFGGLRALPDEAALESLWASLGPDALGVSANELHGALSGTTRCIKAALLDQTVVAGVGNIYADESLFRAGLNPLRRADSIRVPEAERLAAAIRQVLQDAVTAGGSTLRDYVTPDGDAGGYQARHQVYGRAGLACERCGKPLASDVIAGRTSVWCRTCQPTRPRGHERPGKCPCLGRYSSFPKVIHTDDEST